MKFFGDKKEPGKRPQEADPNWVGNFQTYLSAIQKQGTWATYLECFALATALRRTILVLADDGQVWHFAHEETVPAICLFYQEDIGHYEFLAGEVEQELRQWATRHNGPGDRRAVGGAKSLCLSDFGTPSSKSHRRQTATAAKSHALKDFDNLSDFATPRSRSHKALTDFATPQTIQCQETVGADFDDSAPVFAPCRPLPELIRFVKALGGTPSTVPALRASWGTTVQRAGALVQAGRTLQQVRHWEQHSETEHQFIRIPRKHCQSAWACQICAMVWPRFSLLRLAVSNKIDQACHGKADRAARLRGKGFKNLWRAAPRKDKQVFTRLMNLSNIECGVEELRQKFGRQPGPPAKTKALAKAAAAAATKKRYLKVKSLLPNSPLQRKVGTLPGSPPRLSSSKKSAANRQAITSWTCDICETVIHGQTTADLSTLREKHINKWHVVVVVSVASFRVV